MNRLIRTGLMAVAIAVAASIVLTAPVAADIYMWRDADGTVHYGDKPGTRDAKKLDIESRATNNAAVADRYSKRQAARTEFTASRAEQRADAQEEAATAAAEAADRQTRCEQARERLRNYLNSRRLYRLNDDGERQYLDDAQIVEARSRAEEAVNEHCD